MQVFVMVLKQAELNFDSRRIVMKECFVTISFAIMVHSPAHSPCAA